MIELRAQTPANSSHIAQLNCHIGTHHLRWRVRSTNDTIDVQFLP